MGSLSVEWSSSFSMVFSTVVLCLCIFRSESSSVNATLGQEVTLPCEIKVNGPDEECEWKIGTSINDSTVLALTRKFIGEDPICGSGQGECSLRADCTLVLQKVTEADFEHKYFCVRRREKYYAEYTLNLIHEASTAHSSSQAPESTDEHLCVKPEQEDSIQASSGMGMRISTAFAIICFVLLCSTNTLWLCFYTCKRKAKTQDRKQDGAKSKADGRVEYKSLPKDADPEMNGTLANKEEGNTTVDLRLIDTSTDPLGTVLASKTESGLPVQSESQRETDHSPYKKSKPTHPETISGCDAVDLSGCDAVDSSDISSSTSMKVLMLDFNSGPKMKFLPLKDIPSNGMEIQSSSEDFLQVIRKTEEEQDIVLISEKDGHKWKISAGEQFSFYVSCGECKGGCFFVEMSDGEKPHKKEVL